MYTLRAPDFSSVATDVRPMRMAIHSSFANSGRPRRKIVLLSTDARCLFSRSRSPSVAEAPASPAPLPAAEAPAGEASSPCPPRSRSAMPHLPRLQGIRAGGAASTSRAPAQCTAHNTRPHSPLAVPLRQPDTRRRLQQMDMRRRPASSTAVWDAVFIISRRSVLSRAEPLHPLSATKQASSPQAVTISAGKNYAREFLVLRGKQFATEVYKKGSSPGVPHLGYKATRAA